MLPCNVPRSSPCALNLKVTPRYFWMSVGSYPDVNQCEPSSRTTFIIRRQKCCMPYIFCSSLEISYHGPIKLSGPRMGNQGPIRSLFEESCPKSEPRGQFPPHETQLLIGAAGDDDAEVVPIDPFSKGVCRGGRRPR